MLFTHVRFKSYKTLCKGHRWAISTYILNEIVEIVTAYLRELKDEDKMKIISKDDSKVSKE